MLPFTSRVYFKRNFPNKRDILILNIMYIKKDEISVFLTKNVILPVFINFVLRIAYVQGDSLYRLFSVC